MTPRRELTGALCALAAVLLAACGATAEGGNTTSVAVETVPTVPNVGALPAPLDLPEATVVETTAEPVDTVATTTTTTTPFGATGNRILMLGDSILASTSKRYSNTMCQALVPLGWQVRIEAEVSRPIQFGVEVMRAVGDEDWDAGLVFLGTNPGGDANEFMKQLNRIILDFGDVPVALVTISEYRDTIGPINDVIEAMPDVYDNVSVVDWHALTDGRAELLWEDGIHPTTEGRELLAAAVAERVGQAPEGSEGRCLDSSYTDDSAGTIDGRPRGSSSGSSGSSGTGSTSRTTTTTAQGATTTTVRPNGPTTTVANTGPTTTSATGGTATTSPTQTTTPGSPTQTTSPSPNTTVTNPPATSPPPTTPEVPAASISNG